MTKKNRTSDSAAETNSDLKFTGNSAADQRIRVLNHLRNHGSLSTLEARHLIDVMHPAARVMELRNHGNDIQTVWNDGYTPEGKRHRIARYFLIREAGANQEFPRVQNTEDSE